MARSTSDIMLEENIIPPSVSPLNIDDQERQRDFIDIPSELPDLGPPNLRIQTEGASTHTASNQAPANDKISHMREGQHNVLFIPHVRKKTAEINKLRTVGSGIGSTSSVTSFNVEGVVPNLPYLHVLSKLATSYVYKGLGSGILKNKI